MRRAFCRALLGLVVGAMGTATAQETGTIEAPQELTDTIVVTANRFSLSTTNSVWPVTVVDLSADRATTSLDAALEGTDGIDLRSAGGLGSVSTLSNWGVFNRHLLLLYNGRVVKDYSLGGFNLSDFSSFEFERIEILKGPQSAFYGSDAVGGVVNLLTPTSFADRAEFTTQIGTLGYRSYRAHLSRIVGPFGVGGLAEYTSTDNRRPNAGVERTLFDLRADYLSPDRRHRIMLSARYFEDSLGVPGPLPDPAAIPVYGNTQSSSLTDRQQDENYSVDAQYRFFDPALGELHADLFWEKKNLDYRSIYNYRFQYTTIDSFINPPDTALNIDSVDVHSASIIAKRSSGINLRYSRELRGIYSAAGIDWLSGALAATTDDTSYATSIAGPFAPYGYQFRTFNFWSAKQNQFDLWGNLAADVLTPLRLDVSGRLQFVEDRTTQPSYNLGLILKPDMPLSFKLGYGYAFRLPSLAEQFADGVYTAGSVSLDPEIARTWQGTVGYKDAAGRIDAGITLFYQRISALIQYRADPNTFRSVPENVERFRTVGVDVTAHFRPLDNLTVQFGGVWQNAQQSIEGGRRLVGAFYIPDLKWRADITWSRGRLSTRLNLRHTSERPIILFGGNEKTVASVYELGGRVRAQLTSYLNLFLEAYDLTDERRPDQFGFTITDGDYPTIGRQLLLGMQVALK